MRSKCNISVSLHRKIAKTLAAYLTRTLNYITLHYINI